MNQTWWRGGRGEGGEGEGEGAERGQDDGEEKHADQQEESGKKIPRSTTGSPTLHIDTHQHNTTHNYTFPCLAAMIVHFFFFCRSVSALSSLSSPLQPFVRPSPIVPFPHSWTTAVDILCVNVVCVFMSCVFLRVFTFLSSFLSSSVFLFVLFSLLSVLFSAVCLCACFVLFSRCCRWRGHKKATKLSWSAAWNRGKKQR